ncbi:hypothetical protein AMAG_10131 [Allomyces macrogynus ATCC 38327]|uniref:F-box domain-containing protein n=1 Tax=Allomyces macrogynus (strain ATCC 38327) TaxID=578462 RepID=A0A0L0SQG9_ALLM3|nr:hypothetical protein AMAG_10131 [Allomyces macrogynus ATCC 38327]|eukprot:KNE64788.1 hypothetical protein AMAG_10131 [Allomyces macrogynus ATCC 38327]
METRLSSARAVPANASRRRAALADLPMELLAMILRSLTREDRVQLLATCKKMQSVVRPVLAQRRVLFFSSLPVLIWQLASLPWASPADTPMYPLPVVLKSANSPDLVPSNYVLRELVLVADVRSRSVSHAYRPVSMVPGRDPRGAKPAVRPAYGPLMAVNGTQNQILLDDLATLTAVATAVFPKLAQLKSVRALAVGPEPSHDDHPPGPPCPITQVVYYNGKQLGPVPMGNNVPLWVQSATDVLLTHLPSTTAHLSLRCTFPVNYLLAPAHRAPASHPLADTTRLELAPLDPIPSMFLKPGTLLAVFPQLNALYLHLPILSAGHFQALTELAQLRELVVTGGMADTALAGFSALADLINAEPDTATVETMLRLESLKLDVKVVHRDAPTASRLLAWFMRRVRTRVMRFCGCFSLPMPCVDMGVEVLTLQSVKVASRDIPDQSTLRSLHIQNCRLLFEYRHNDTEDDDNLDADPPPTRRLAPRFSKLDTLTMRVVDDHWRVLPHLLDSVAPTVRTVVLSGMLAVTDATVATLVLAAPKLAKITITHCPNVDHHLGRMFAAAARARRISVTVDWKSFAKHPFTWLAEPNDRPNWGPRYAVPAARRTRKGSAVALVQGHKLLPGLTVVPERNLKPGQKHAWAAARSPWAMASTVAGEDGGVLVDAHGSARQWPEMRERQGGGAEGESGESDEDDEDEEDEEGEGEDEDGFGLSSDDEDDEGEPGWWSGDDEDDDDEDDDDEDGHSHDGGGGAGVTFGPFGGFEVLFGGFEVGADDHHAPQLAWGAMPDFTDDDDDDGYGDDEDEDGESGTGSSYSAPNEMLFAFGGSDDDNDEDWEGGGADGTSELSDLSDHGYGSDYGSDHGPDDAEHGGSDDGGGGGGGAGDDDEMDEGPLHDDDHDYATASDDGTVSGAWSDHDDAHEDAEHDDDDEWTTKSSDVLEWWEHHDMPSPNGGFGGGGG